MAIRSRAWLCWSGCSFTVKQSWCRVPRFVILLPIKWTKQQQSSTRWLEFTKQVDMRLSAAISTWLINDFDSISNTYCYSDSSRQRADLSLFPGEGTTEEEVGGQLARTLNSLMRILRTWAFENIEWWTQKLHPGKKGQANTVHVPISGTYLDNTVTVTTSAFTVYSMRYTLPWNEFSVKNRINIHRNSDSRRESSLGFTFRLRRLWERTFKLLACNL